MNLLPCARSGSERRPGISYAMKLIALSLTLSLFLAGCVYSRAEHDLKREEWYSGTATIRAEHREWATALATTQPFSVLPNLTRLAPQERAAWLKIRDRNHELFDKSIEQDRQQK